MGTIAIVTSGHDDAALGTASEALGTLLGATTSELRPAGRERAASVRELVATADDTDVVIVALSGADPLVPDAMAKVRKPLLVVPHGLAPAARVRRVLVPLDGDPTTSATVSDIVERAAAAGAWTCVVHVFDVHTAPAFWDQAAHTRPAWSEEFRRRHLPVGDRVDLRSGDPSDEVIAAARSDDADLVVIGWRRNLSDGHARVVRRLVAESPAPVLLLGAGDTPASGP